MCLSYQSIEGLRITGMREASICNVLSMQEITFKKTLWPLFMDMVQLPEDWLFTLSDC